MQSGLSQQTSALDKTSSSVAVGAIGRPNVFSLERRLARSTDFTLANKARFDRASKQMFTV